MKYCLKTENDCLKLQTKHPQIFTVSGEVGDGGKVVIK